MSKDYFRIVDLNPNIGGLPLPVNDPRDPRALCYFGFVANRQRLLLATVGLPQGIRILYSFDLDHFVGGGLPQLPPPGKVHPHGVLEFAGSPNGFEEALLDHDRSHVIIWLDPSSPVPVTQAVAVSVRASARD